MCSPRKIVGIFFLLLASLIISSCGSCKKECRQQYDRGYSAGRDAGYSTGYDRGKAVGLDEGEEIGYAKGRDIGISEGRKIGLFEGRKILVADGFLPTVGAALLFLIFASFLYFFHRSIGSAVSGVMKQLKSMYLYFLIKVNLRRVEKDQATRAEISSKIASLELYTDVQEAINSMEYMNEYFLISSKIDIYFMQFQMVSRKKLNTEISRIAGGVVFNKKFDQSERNKLLSSIKLLLLARLSRAKNLLEYERKSYRKICTDCIAYVSAKKSYRAYHLLRRMAILFSFILNLALMLVFASIFELPQLIVELVD